MRDLRDRAPFGLIRLAVDAGASYAGPLGPLPVRVAIDIACDELGIPLDVDRRVVRHLVERKLEASSSDQGCRKAG